MTITSKRPKVIKLHGDYLFDDLKSTLRETESLEQNMKAKLTEFSKEHGLIVIGYSGTDRSIMETLHALLRNEEYMKSGIYWCIRKGDDISEELRKLLFKDRVYFIEIDGFDDFFAQLFAKLNSGKILPDSALGVNRKNSENLNALINSITNFPSNNSLLTKAKERLERHTTRSALASLIAREKDEDRPNISATKMNDAELLMLSEISELIFSENYQEAFERINLELNKQSKPSVKRAILEQKISANINKKNYEEAKRTADLIIEIEPDRASSYIEKSKACNNYEEKIVCLNTAIKADPYYFNTYVNLCDIYLSQSKRFYGEEKTTTIKEALANADKAANLLPIQSNSIWYRYFDIFDVSINIKEERLQKKNEILDKIKDQNPYSKTFLELKYKSICEHDEKDKNKNLEELLIDIKKSENRYSDEYGILSKLRLDVLSNIKDELRIKKEISRLENETNSDPDLAVRIAKIHREIFGDDHTALDLLKRSLRTSQFDWEVLEETIKCLCDINQISEARNIFCKWSNRLSYERNHYSNLYILESEKRYDECLKSCIEFSKFTGKNEVSNQAYYLLLADENLEAENIMKNFLEKIRFTPEAAVEIVNYELARKNQNKKPDSSRLNKVLSFSSDSQTKVGIYALLDDKKNLIESINESLTKDKTARFLFPRWPVLKKYLDDPDIIKVLSLNRKLLENSIF